MWVDNATPSFLVVRPAVSTRTTEFCGSFMRVICSSTEC
jgi:hypothetical protein